MDDYRERIAAVQHKIWSHWMRYLFSVCGNLNDDGSATIPAYNVERWHRQMETGYAALTDKERESDRNQADKVLAERDAEIALRKAELADSQSDVAQLLTTVEQQRQYIERLKAQVAELEATVDEATTIAAMYGQTDGDHHKLWVIDQMVRVLEGSNYEQFVRVACNGEDGPDTFQWDVGIAP